MYLGGLIVGLVLTVVFDLSKLTPRFVACDVGQGDGLLLIKGNTQVIVDGGPSGEKILDCLSRQIPFWDRQIELIVLTNTDYDHMNGLSSVVERYNVVHFVTADGVHESQSLDRFSSLLMREAVRIHGVEQGETITVGTDDKLTLKVLWPPDLIEEYVAVFSNQIASSEREQILGASAKRGDLNERSVVLLWEESGYKTLLMGDAGFQAEKSLVESAYLSDVDLLKVGHHGSKYASSFDFIRSITPESAVISVGRDNRYGHPTEETLQRLKHFGIAIWRTDQNGDFSQIITGR